MGRGLRAAARAMLVSGRLPHTVIIEDPDAARGLELAEFLAKGALCRGEDPPCGACVSCRKAEKRCHSDLTYVSGGTKTKSMPVEKARELRAHAFIAPGEGNRRVYILSEAGCLSVPCQNVLLKILEEPPAFVLFILICASRTELLETVLSRGVLLSDFGEEAVDWELALEAAAAVFAPGELTLLKLFQEQGGTRDDLRALLEGMEMAFSRLLRCKNGVSDDFASRPEAAGILARATGRSLLSLMEACAGLVGAFSLNPNQTLLMTAACGKLRRAAGL